jgi:hypothetical protein
MQLYEEFKEYEIMWDNSDDPKVTEFDTKLQERLMPVSFAGIDIPPLEQILLAAGSFIAGLFWLVIAAVAGVGTMFLGAHVWPTYLYPLLSPYLASKTIELIESLSTLVLSFLAGFLPAVKAIESENTTQAILYEAVETTLPPRVDFQQLAAKDPAFKKQLQNFYDFARKDLSLNDETVQQLLVKLETELDVYLNKHPEILKLDSKVFEKNKAFIISNATKKVQKEIKEVKAQAANDIL